jgi:hypothetical protein
MDPIYVPAADADAILWLNDRQRLFQSQIQGSKKEYAGMSTSGQDRRTSIRQLCAGLPSLSSRYAGGRQP